MIVEPNSYQYLLVMEHLVHDDPVVFNLYQGRVVGKILSHVEIENLDLSNVVRHIHRHNFHLVGFTTFRGRRSAFDLLEPGIEGQVHQPD